MVLENISKCGTVYYWGLQTVPGAFPLPLAGQRHWEMSMPAGHSELIQDGLGGACLNSGPSNLFYPLIFGFCCSCHADKLESSTSSLCASILLRKKGCW